MSADDGSDGYDHAVSRRKILSVAGASGVAALAGCASGGDSGGSDPTDSGDSGTTSGGDSVHQATYTNAYTGNPADLHFNTSGIQNYRWPAGRSVFAPFMKYSFTSSEFILGALSDLTIDGQEVTLTFRDDLKWDNGDEWTTEDFDV
nr:hypothetical protein [Halobacterium sp. CBA1126]